MRQHFDATLDGGGLADTWHTFTLAERWRFRLSTHPETPLPEEYWGAFEQQGWERAILARFRDAWATQTLAPGPGWRAWYLDGTISGETLADWQAIPDGIVAMVVDVAHLDPDIEKNFDRLNQLVIRPGYGRCALGTNDPYWWDPYVSFPRDCSRANPHPPTPPEFKKQGIWVSNAVMSRVRASVILSLDRRLLAREWP